MKASWNNLSTCHVWHNDETGDILTTSVNKLYSIRINQVRCTLSRVFGLGPYALFRANQTLTLSISTCASMWPDSVLINLPCETALLGVNCSSLSVSCKSTAEVAQALDYNVGLFVSPVAQNIGRQKTVNKVYRIKSLHAGELREARASTSSDLRIGEASGGTGRPGIAWRLLLLRSLRGAWVLLGRSVILLVRTMSSALLSIDALVSFFNLC